MTEMAWGGKVDDLPGGCRKDEVLPTCYLYAQTKAMAGRMKLQGGQPRQPSVYTRHVGAVPPAYARVYGEVALGSDPLHLSSISMGFSAMAMGAMGAINGCGRRWHLSSEQFGGR